MIIYRFSGVGFRKMTKYISRNFSVIVVITAMLLCFSQVSFAAPSESTLSKTLGWINQPNNPYNICGGYYKELPIIYIPSPYVTSQKQNYDFKSDETIYSFKGVSQAKGNVKVTQKDSEMTSNVAYMYRHKTTNTPKTIKMVGNVRLRSPGQLVVANAGEFDVVTKAKTLDNVQYRMALGKQGTVIVKNPKTGKFEKHLYQLNARGEAKKFKQVNPKLDVLKSASYTTCPPISHTWLLRASSVTLDSKKGRGTSWNTRLLIHGFPIFYTPYFNFPIDKKRKTGFLLPTFGLSNSDGFSTSVPFYWNIAPNYDATLTPKIFTKRGILTNGLFRYSTLTSSGKFDAGYIKNDREFKSFQKSAASKYSGNPALGRILTASDDRRAFSWQNDSTFNDHWKNSVDYNYVSDDYYVQDFDTNIMDVSNDQLMRRANVNFLSENWDFLGNFQEYQTLHKVNGDATNQYARLPQLQLNSDYPDELLGLDYSFTSEFDRFVKNTDPGAVRAIQGDRVILQPAIKLPLTWLFAFLTPEAKLQMTKYQVQHEVAGNPDNPGMAIPIFDIKGGLYFDRSLSLFKHDYRQTLEPELYYLYVPYRNQNHMPIFDAAAQTFSYDQMFSTNSFSGLDRVVNANQVTYGLTSRFIDDDTGDQKAIISVGQIHYFADRKVSLYSGRTPPAISSTDRQVVSPITATATYDMTNHWSATGSAAWNSHQKSFDSDSLDLSYRLGPFRLINFGYDFVRGGDTLSGMPSGSPRNNLNQTNVTSAWRLTDHWGVLGRWNYNWSQHHVQAFFYGVTYDSCCWAVRFLNGRTFVGPSPLNINRSYNDYSYRYDTVFYIQFALKGLGAFGDGSAQGFLESNITNYVDQFGEVNKSDV